MAAMDKWKLVDTMDEAKDVIAKLKEKQILYVDGEGVQLSKDGQLCILQITAENDIVYLFDIVTLGKEVFANGKYTEL